MGATEMDTMSNVPLPLMIYLRGPRAASQPISASNLNSKIFGINSTAVVVDNIYKPATNLASARLPRGSFCPCPPCATALTTVTSAATASTGLGLYAAEMGLAPTVLAGRSAKIGTYRFSVRSVAGGDFTSQIDRLKKYDLICGLD